MNHAKEILAMREVIAFLLCSFSISSSSGAMGSSLLMYRAKGAIDFKRGVRGLVNERDS